MIIIAIGIFVLSFVSGMLGIGAAFAVTPLLSFFMDDLVNEVQPFSLLLNVLTALAAAFGFAKSGYVRFRQAWILAAVMAAVAPIGAYLVQFVPTEYVWYTYLLSVVFLLYRMFSQTTAEIGENFPVAVALSVPIAALSGFLGVGPGFLLMPALVILGYEMKLAAGINAIAVTLPSFTALLPHVPTAHFDWGVDGWLLLIGVTASFLGARASSGYVPVVRIKQLFVVLLIGMTIYKITTL